ncbi:MAG: bifunctional adenosylcobinamide kinase/adenosylcobinamide-phosphate guanylyltransferase [Candidatus Acidulodesulfobacterium sp.]
MAKIFVTGGISSGKSQFAENTALALYKSNITADAGMTSGMAGGAETDPDNFPLLHFIATAKTNINIKDGEMILKIKRHRERRSKAFAVHENFGDLTAEIDAVHNSFSDGRIADRCVILIDSMTLWLSSFFTDVRYFDSAAETVLKFAEYLSGIRCSVVTVSDSLGFNLVPADAYVRKFIELNGLMEQKLSAVSDKAYCVIAGNPLALK